VARRKRDSGLFRLRGSFKQFNCTQVFNTNEWDREKN
jgi:hypothetical protein